MRSVTLILVLTLNAAFVMAQDKVEPLQQVAKSADSFSTLLFKKIAKENVGQNIISSPLSAYLALSMTAYGASGNTEKQMRQSLNLPTSDFGHEGFKKLIDQLSSVEKVILEVANKMYVARGVEVKSDYQQLTSGSFNSETSQLDTNKPLESAQLVNKWVDEKTHHKISNIVTEDDITRDFRLLLLNAVYFKGTWANVFKKDFTVPRNFHVNQDNVKLVPTMYISGNFRYGELPDLQARFIELPYQNKDLQMVIIVPDEINGLSSIIDNLESFNYTRLASAAVETEVQLYLPKFKIESKIGLEESLKKVGMTDMFSDIADFSKLSIEPLKVDKVLQKAFIEVNEEGSTAAAVSKLCKERNENVCQQKSFVATLFEKYKKSKQDDCKKVCTDEPRDEESCDNVVEPPDPDPCQPIVPENKCAGMHCFIKEQNPLAACCCELKGAEDDEDEGGPCPPTGCPQDPRAPTCGCDLCRKSGYHGRCCDPRSPWCYGHQGGMKDPLRFNKA